MKLTTFAVLVAAVLSSANAVPCSHTDNDPTVLANRYELEVVTQTEICWRACFPEKPTCPPGWVAKELGMCWTCCLVEEGSTM